MRDGFVDEEAVRAEIAPCFIEQDGARTDIVVLACSTTRSGEPHAQDSTWPVDWLDPAERSPGGRCRCWQRVRPFCPGGGG